MQKIRAIEINNFQSHADSRLEFEEGLNVITGPSDQGKSAIIRALRWVLYNEPRGTDFIRTGTNSCQVTIELDNEFKITRKRTKKENRYELITPAGEEHVFEKVGSKVPQEIKDVHGMPKIKLDSDLEATLNLDYQLDGAFLLNAPITKRAKVLGRLIKVHIVDAAIRDTSKDLRELKQEEKRVKQELVELDNKLEEFNDLPALAKEIKKQEELLVQIKKINQKVTEIKSFQQRMNLLDQKLNKWHKLDQKLGNLTEIEGIYDKITAKSEQLRALKQLLKRKSKIEDGLDQAAKYMKGLENVKEIEQIYKQLEEKWECYQRLKGFSSKLNQISTRIKQNKGLIEKTDGVEESSQILNDKLVTVNKKITALLQFKDDLVKVEQSIDKKQELLNLLPEVEQVDQVQSQLLQSYKQLEQLSELAARKEVIETRIKNTTVELEQGSKENKKLVREYSKKLKTMGKCPTCFSAVDQQVIQGIINNYRGN
ncbi:AAA family ATPase [Natroniella sulfidigena]|uniref:AAA family ATPase n=1 Tax=Natroniella sulfidigena TaxID=723921 RepID=UPI00200B1B71|nr:AAA family ATPase [Natroniella sulfidigena]MCK8817763.1 AAA family ATPase [Natroniella sulfidigena]